MNEEFKNDKIAIHSNEEKSEFGIELQKVENPCSFKLSSQQMIIINHCLEDIYVMCACGVIGRTNDYSITVNGTQWCIYASNDSKRIIITVSNRINTYDIGICAIFQMDFKKICVLIAQMQNL